MRTTFINQNSEKTIVEDGEKYMTGRIEDFEDFMKARDMESAKMRSGERDSFYDYGLSYDYVELGTFDDQEEDYFRYQLSWGGPSDEVRFYEDGTIVYAFMDWFCGVGFDVTDEDWAKWLKDWFEGCEMMNFQTKREDYDYYEQLDRIVNPDDYEEEPEEVENEDEEEN